jgi:hypothetical protein
VCQAPIHTNVVLRRPDVTLKCQKSGNPFYGINTACCKLTIYDRLDCLRCGLYTCFTCVIREPHPLLFPEANHKLTQVFVQPYFLTGLITERVPFCLWSLSTLRRTMASYMENAYSLVHQDNAADVPSVSAMASPSSFLVWLTPE